MHFSTQGKNPEMLLTCLFISSCLLGQSEHKTCVLCFHSVLSCLFFSPLSSSEPYNVSYNLLVALFYISVFPLHSWFSVCHKNYFYAGWNLHSFFSFVSIIED